jgi:hypothetical protein
MQQTPADPAEDPDPTPTYAQVLECRFAALTEREQQILERRTLSDDPETLDVIGASMGNISRERVRQLETRAVNQLTGAPAPKKGRPRLQPVVAHTAAELLMEQAYADQLISDALSELADLPLPVTDPHLVAAGFAPLDSRATRLLLAVARAKHTFGNQRLTTAEFGGQRWLFTGDGGPADLVAALIGEHAVGGVVEDLVELWDAVEQRLTVHTGSATDAAVLASDLVGGLGAVEVNGRYALLGARLGVNDQISRILRAHGGPMTAEEILAYLPDRNRRTVENALVDKAAPFMRVTRHEFNLKDAPGAVRHRTLRQVIYDEVNEHGQVSVQHLQELAEQQGNSRASIAFYSWLPGLIEDGGVLRRRLPSDPPAAVDPGLDDECFRVVAGPHRGRWSYTTTFAHSRLYHGSQIFPAPLAVELGVDPGATRELLKVNGVKVRGSWRHGPYLFSRDLRPVLLELGLADGDRMRLIEVGPGELVIEKVPELNSADGPFRTLAEGAGLYDENGAQLPDGDIADALAFAVGLPHAPLGQIERRLRTRRNHDLADALVLLFPEQLAS